MPYWLIPGLQSLYYFWTMCEALSLVHMVWFNSDKELVRLCGQVKYTPAGKAYTFMWVVVTYIYVSYLFG